MALIDKIASISNLLEAWEKVSGKKSYAGYDGITGSGFSKNLQFNLETLSYELTHNLYQPYCPKPSRKDKRISMLTIRDRLVCYAILNELEGILSPNLSRHSYAYQKEKSTFSALDRAKNSIFNLSLTHYFKSDFTHFFDSIDHFQLLAQIDSHIKCLSTQELLKKIIQINVVADGQLISKTQGLIWGNPLSPLLSNLYMINVDQNLGDYFPLYIRYSDDILIGLGKPITPSELNFINDQLKSMKLSLNKKKTAMGSFADGVPYLGSDLKTRVEDDRKRLASLYINPSIEDKDLSKYLNSEVDYILVTFYKQHHGLEAIMDSDFEWDGIDLEKMKSVATGEGPLIKKLGYMSDIFVYSGRYDFAEEVNKFIKLVENMKGLSEPDIEICQSIHKLFFQEQKNYFLGTYTNGQREYKIVNKVMHFEDLRLLISKQGSVAIRLLKTTNDSSIFVLDIDIEKKVLLEFDGYEKVIEGLLRQALTYALSIQAILKSYNISAYIEFSGYKGYHVWIFLTKEMSPTLFWEHIRPLFLNIYKPKGVQVEYLPKMLYEDQELIKVPYSYHEVTKLQATFITSEGISVTDHLFIDEICRNDIETINGVELSFEKSIIPIEEYLVENPCQLSDFPDYITELFNQCKLMKRIVDKAFIHNYLNHFERNAILYTFGHCGQIGKRFVHFVISQCLNYNSTITENYLQKLQSFPVSCAKLKLRFSDLYGECSCDFSSYPLFYPSPVIFAFRKNNIVVTKPDYIQHDIQVQQTIALYETSQISELADQLVALTKSKNKIEKEIRICVVKLEDLFEKNNINEYETDIGKLIRVENEWLFKLKLNS
ncbi:reverse transcriptase domain-containing protein [Fusibacter sp. 3D3]|uniref:reverse transcriptase domain-containing protein n=1 Tax=Fusibacter sp. 3D3 TaxID=1048380 RepID=UPI000853DA75|nr:reverse transcriptase domain-containing protein [Fusibacter sp. 3D3]GAU78639.1 retron-type RNA-directed DNA polymerase [Fusibacter sp. 3D3]